MTRQKIQTANKSLRNLSILESRNIKCIKRATLSCQIGLTKESTYRPLLVMTISVPSLWNFSHKSLLSSVTLGSSTTPSSSGGSCGAKGGGGGGRSECEWWAASAARTASSYDRSAGKHAPGGGAPWPAALAAAAARAARAAAGKPGAPYGGGEPAEAVGIALGVSAGEELGPPVVVPPAEVGVVAESDAVDEAGEDVSSEFTLEQIISHELWGQFPESSSKPQSTVNLTLSSDFFLLCFSRNEIISAHRCWKTNGLTQNLRGYSGEWDQFSLERISRTLGYRLDSFLPHLSFPSHER